MGNYKPKAVLDGVKKEDWDGIKSETVRLANWKNQVILSCRDVAYLEDFIPAQFKIYEVIGFSEEQQRQFLNKWFEGEPGKAEKLFKDLKSNPRIREFTQNPLLLSLTAVLCENDPEFQLPMQRIDFND
ncbi:MAG: hypothetical protein H8D67_04380 [Deltaproteobacteria bacterium]|nr:hypothetical protein [Deltaproteobacteria bacterium]